MFAMSFVACIGVFWDNKYMLLGYCLGGILMGIVLTMSAVASGMLLSASVPPLIMQTNRICRNFEQVGSYFGCDAYRISGYERRLAENSGPTVLTSLARAKVAVAWGADKANDPR